MASNADRKLLEIATRAQREQATAMIASLSSSTAEELVPLAQMIGAVRMYMDKSADVSLLDPAQVFGRDPTWCTRTALILDEFISSKDFEKANALAIWLFTVRAASDPALQDTGPAIWREIARAFPLLAKMAEDPRIDRNTTLMLAEMQKRPAGS